MRIVSGDVARLPGHSLTLIDGVRGDALCALLDDQGFAVAPGAACHSGAREPSSALAAMGVGRSEALGALRCTFGEGNGPADGERLARRDRDARADAASGGRRRARMRLSVADLARAGVLERPDGDGSAGGSACGDRVRIQLRLDSAGQIAEARFGALGCAAASAAAAWCAEHAEGGSLLDAATLSLARCVTEREIPDERHDCAAVALDALAEAIADAIAALPAIPAGARTAVAMSGGVDSAVALQRIVDRGDSGRRHHAAPLDRPGRT